MRPSFLALFLLALPLHAEQPPAADLILHHGKVVTVDPQFRIVEAVAVKSGRIVALGEDADVLKRSGPATKVIDVQGRTVLPGLYDSHVHPLGAATSELAAPLPRLRSLKDVFAYIREQAAHVPPGEWIVVRYAFPTRLEEARFPTKQELDEAAPKHPVLYHAGPAGMVNSLALQISGITRDTPHPKAGMIVKDPRTGEPTGMIRNAYRALKGVPSGAESFSNTAKREAVKRLFKLYNQQGITSVADRNGNREALDLYLALQKDKELTVRVNVARSFDPSGTREQIVRQLDGLPGKDQRGGPTGVGDEQVRIGPIKLFLDGGMLNGSAYMRQPWPPGETYQIVENDYRGLLFIEPEQLQLVCEEAARRGWQLTAHTAGEGAMDVLLDAYEMVNRLVPIKEKRFCITHANFPSQRNLERCRALGVCADVQPAWLYKDGATLEKVLGSERIRWFQPYKSWLKYTTIGGGSDHMIKLDSFDATNPWNPWLGMAVAISRVTERGTFPTPDERLSREEAIRLYTINNAYLHHEEKEKGSLEVGKLGDLIVLDRDILTCAASEIPWTRTLLTVLGGALVYEAEPQERAKDKAEPAKAEPDKADAPKWTKDVIYGRKFGLALTMDVFQPKEKANGAAVVFVVSGGWFSAREAINPGFIKVFLDRGYTVFAVVHGSQPRFTIPEAVADLNRAVRYIRNHAQDYGIDPDRIGITGGSAGGHLSLMQGLAGTTGDPKAKDPVERESSRVQAVACFFPPTDFLNYGKEGEVALGSGVLSGFKAPFEFMEMNSKTRSFDRVNDEEKRRAIGRQVSPITHVSADDPPTLIIHGDADKLVPIQQAEIIIAKLKEAGVPAELVVRKDAQHGWPGMDKDLGVFADWFDKYLKKK